MTLLVFKDGKLTNNKTYKTLKGALEFGIGGSGHVILESGVGVFNGIGVNEWLIGGDGKIWSSDARWRIIDVEEFTTEVLSASTLGGEHEDA